MTRWCVPAALVATLVVGTARAQPPEAPLADAKREGQLTVIGLPRDRCGYGALIDGFKAKYGLKVAELSPEASAADSLAAIKAGKADVIDVSVSAAAAAKADGVLQPFQPTTWAAIPPETKDAEGYWIGGYYGVLAFQVNKDLVKVMPADWSDLLAADDKGAVALAGDPRTSRQAMAGVYAAGVAAGAKDGAAVADAGLKFFADLNRRGNFVPVIGKAGTLAQGITPIVLRWDYLAFADRDSLKGNPPTEIIIPRSGVVADLSVQAISAVAPHPAAARLWIEYLASDEGQIGWLKGGCHPVRYHALAAAGRVAPELAARLPPAEAYAKISFPAPADQDAAKSAIAGGWDSLVGAPVK